MKNEPSALLRAIQDSPYQGYAYSYPHKHAYRPFPQPVSLSECWKTEDKGQLYLYTHIPFCEMRCGFCNLFTTTNPKESIVHNYLDSLAREAEAAAEYLGPHRFARGAIGGGTPSFLNLSELERLFFILHDTLGGVDKNMPLSFEVSPATVNSEKLSFLREQGVTRISMGVQSFIKEETNKLGRRQDPVSLQNALTLMKQAKFPIMNLDLIYGAQNQTPDSWAISLQKAIDIFPEELYLYPLYVRPLTGLGKSGADANDQRLILYRQARDALLAAGYQQISMRLFRKRDVSNGDNQMEGPVYCCQEDGMLGLGAGARSYTQNYHYSTDYAVGRKGIMDIIRSYCDRSETQHRHADYGYQLDLAEHKRRYVIKSLLRFPGLDTDDYTANFGTNIHTDFPELEELLCQNFAVEKSQHLCLTDKGMEYSDTIGPWLTSPEVVKKINNFDLK